MTTTTTTTTSAAPARLPWWTGGDTNAAFGLGFNVMVNVLVLTGLCLGVVHIPDHDVFDVFKDIRHGSVLLVNNGPLITVAWIRAITNHGSTNSRG